MALESLKHHGAGSVALLETVRIKGQALRVIGVLAPKGDTLGGGEHVGSADDQAFVPLSAAQQRLFGARTRRQWAAGAVDRAVGDQEPGYQCSAGADLSAAARAASAQGRWHGRRLPFLQPNPVAWHLDNDHAVMTAFLAAVAGISLLVGGIGIMHIMLVSMTSRTREIGLRKAVGARSRDIRLQFIVETLVLSLAGG